FNLYSMFPSDSTKKGSKYLAPFSTSTKKPGFLQIIQGDNYPLSWQKPGFFVLVENGARYLLPFLVLSEGNIEYRLKQVFQLS
ncbi:MAG: hypothetical protein AAFV71_24135, partial [Cyanobacteria bacterium J06633_8]